MKHLICVVCGSVVVSLSMQAANIPIAASGWNRDIIVESTASLPYSGAASPFDVPNNYGFYEAGLAGGTRGLPSSRSFTSLVDGSTIFQFQPYSLNNVLQLSASTSSSGTLTLATPGIFSSISILAAAANSGASQGNLVFHFSDATVSPTLQFNNSDWFFQPNPAIQGFGRLGLANTSPEDNGASYPELYQTTINLTALGLDNRSIVSIEFFDLSSDPREATGIFGISGTVVPEPGGFAFLALGMVALLGRHFNRVH